MTLKSFDRRHFDEITLLTMPVFHYGHLLINRFPPILDVVLPSDVFQSEAARAKDGYAPTFLYAQLLVSSLPPERAYAAVI